MKSIRSTNKETIFLIILFFSEILLAQNLPRTYIAYMTKEPINVNGKANEND